MAECPLPVAGLFSVAPLEEVIDAEPRVHRGGKGAGLERRQPFLTMAFLALSVIPALKITDRGLVDVERFDLVPLAVE